MSVRTPYDFEIDPDGDSSHVRVLAMIAEGQRVLDVGCSTGYLSRALTDKGCSVVGVEGNEWAAERARGGCEKVLVADLDAPGWEQALGGDRFDVVLAADVLEHLRDPLACLRATLPLLREGGSFVLSLPNVAHGSVRLALLAGEFNYTELGLLDRTHVRFFTRSTVEDLCLQAGTAVVEMHRVERDLDETEIPLVLADLPPGVAEWLAGDTDARTYQFVVRAVPVRGERETALAARAAQHRREADALRSRMRVLTRRGGGAAAESDDAAQLRSTLVELRADLDGRDARLVEAESQLAKRADDLVLLNEMIEAKDGHYVALQEFLARKDVETSGYVASLREHLAAKDAQVQALDQRLRGASGPGVVVPGLYLDLMKRCLTDSIYGNDEPGPDPMDDQFDSSVRFRGAPGGKWPSHAHTMVGMARLDNIQACAEAILRDGVPGDFIETGVWRGGATIFMRAILKAHAVADRTVWVADSFQGLPPPRPALYPADAGDRLHTFHKLAVSEETVRANFEKYGLLDGQVRFLPGFFHESLPHAPVDRLALLRLDGDLYDSTWEALASLYPKVSAGGYVIIDDYALPACRQAVHDFRDRHGISDAIERIDFTGVFWRRS